MCLCLKECVCERQLGAGVKIVVVVWSGVGWGGGVWGVGCGVCGVWWKWRRGDGGLLWF